MRATAAAADGGGRRTARPPSGATRRSCGALHMLAECLLWLARRAPGHPVVMAEHTTQAKIIEQLRILLQLTQNEAQIAQARVAQARTEAVRRELQENGANAEARAQAIAAALRQVGGVPDVVTPALGRVTAVVKTAVEQVEPLAEALLQDLQLEHQLLDRARYLKALAKAADQQEVVELAERLIGAHTATVEWLTTVLAEDALGGPAALASTPLQRVAGTASRLVNLPNRVAVTGVNRYVHAVQQTAEQARSKASQLTEKATSLATGAREVLTSGRNASLKRAEDVAQREGGAQAAEAVHETRRNIGALDASELPIAGYDTLNTTSVIAAIKRLTRPEDIRAVVAYEEAHQARASVVSAAQTRLAAIAQEVVGAGR